MNDITPASHSHTKLRLTVRDEPQGKADVWAQGQFNNKLNRMDFDLYVPLPKTMARDHHNRKRGRGPDNNYVKDENNNGNARRLRKETVPRTLGVIPTALCRLVTLCSGMEAVIQGYENAHVPHEHKVACDNDPNCRRVIELNFSPGIVFNDVATIKMDEMPEHDMLWAGPPCQPYSSAGKGGGLADQKGRGLVILSILKIVETKMPKVVVLENVSNIRKGKHRAMFQAILDMLRDMKKETLHYHVEWNTMNTCDYGVPQSRNRVYVVCVRSDVMQRPLQWPTPSSEPSGNIDSLLGPRPSREFLATALPKKCSKTARANVLAGLEYLRRTGVDPFQETWVLNADDSSNRLGRPQQGCSPCLTRARAARGGHWISTHGRRMGTELMLKLQHMNPDRIKRPDSVSQGRFDAMIGNAMSVNIIEVLLAMLSRSCPAALGITKPLPCQWVTCT